MSPFNRTNKLLCVPISFVISPAYPEGNPWSLSNPTKLTTAVFEPVWYLYKALPAGKYIESLQTIAPLPPASWKGTRSSVSSHLLFVSSYAHNPTLVVAYMIGLPPASRYTNSSVTESSGNGSCAFGVASAVGPDAHCNNVPSFLIPHNCPCQIVKNATLFFTSDEASLSV